MCRSPFDPRGAQAKRETLSSIPFLPASSHLPAYFATRSVTEKTLDGKNGALSPHLLVRCRYSTVGQCEHKVMSLTTRSMHSLLSSGVFCIVIPSFKQTVCIRRPFSDDNRTVLEPERNRVPMRDLEVLCGHERILAHIVALSS